MPMQMLQTRLFDAINPRRREEREAARTHALAAMRTLVGAWCDCHDPSMPDSQAAFKSAQGAARAAVTDLRASGFSRTAMGGEAFHDGWTSALGITITSVLEHRLGHSGGSLPGRPKGWNNGEPYLRPDVLLDSGYTPSSVPITDADTADAYAIQTHDIAFTRLHVLAPSAGYPASTSARDALLDPHAAWITPGGVVDGPLYQRSHTRIASARP